MQPNVKKHKHIKLGPSKLLWSSEPEETTNPFMVTKKTGRGNNKTQFYGTFCYRVPAAEAKYLETIWRDQEVVWERSQGSTYASAIIGGGGRFVWRRKWYAKKVVAIELEFKDVPLKSAAHVPTFDISVRL